MRDEDIPDINNPKTITAVLEGDKLMIIRNQKRIVRTREKRLP